MALLSAKEVKFALAELESGEKAAGVSAPPVVFCKAWPVVKTVLESVISKISNPLIKLCAKVVLQLLEAYAKKCPA